MIMANTNDKIIFATTDPGPSQVELDNRALARVAATDGMVLLKNHGALPIPLGKIALYGAGARMTVKGGTGSGAVRERYSVNIEQGLINAGYEIATVPWLDRFDDFYKESYAEYAKRQEERVKGIKDFRLCIHNVEPFVYPTGIPIANDDVAGDVNTAIYVIARQAGEGHDRHDETGDYLLDDVEMDNLRKVSESFHKLVVVVNAGAAIDLSFMDEIRIDGLVYYGQGGEEGGNALAELISGRANFSGKLSTTWARNYEDYPSAAVYSYASPDEFTQEYTEGIFVGYRYFDTFKVSPRYAFGFGLSYTTFEIRFIDAAINAKTVIVRASVSNTGDANGREVVQLYASYPIKLVAFCKTALLSPGEQETVELSFDINDLADYDESRAAWVIPDSQIILRLGNASDCTVPVCAIVPGAEIITEKCVNICPNVGSIKELECPQFDGDCDNLPIIKLHAKDFTTITHEYKTDDRWRDVRTDAFIDVLSDDEVISLVVGGGTGGVGAVTAIGASGSTTVSLYESRGIPNVICSDGPAGLNLTGRLVELPNGEIKAANVPENFAAYSKYCFGVGKQLIKHKMAKPDEGTERYQYCTAWPCPQLQAQTFDTKLLARIGDGIGKEMEKTGVTVWLGPGMNIIRNPLCGRAFEYYSEDPLLSGKLAAAVTRGVQSHAGRFVSLKHFAANSCELNRNFSDSRMSERTLREIYLKTFEIAVKEANPGTVMASYNMINGVYSPCNRDLLVSVLREEWGFSGLVMSDWDACKADKDDCMKAKSGNVLETAASQCDLVMSGRPDQIEALQKGLIQGLVDIRDLRRSAGRVMELIKANKVLPLGK